jgi:membrane-associated phospholipid phosphatase
MTASGGAKAGASGAGGARAAAFFENIRRGTGAVLRRPRLPPYLPLAAPTSRPHPEDAGGTPALPGEGRAGANFVPAWQRFKIQAVLAICAVALAMRFVDAPVLEFAAGLPPWLVDWAYEVTDFGRSGWILVPLGTLIILIALFASPALDYMSRATLAMVVARLGYVFIAVGLPGLVSTVVKRWIGRVRPSAAGPFAYEPFSWQPDYASFPSGHATTAFAALVAFGAVFPRSRPVLWAYALLIAASRVVVSAHYPSDVIAGAAFGAFGALLVRDWFAMRRLGFFVAPDGAIRPMTGPSRRRIKRVVRALIAS